MKNIQIIDSAENSVYDIFQATEDEFAVIFPDGTDVAFSDELLGDEQSLIALFTEIWKRRIPKKEAQGIHGITFMDCRRKSSTIRREKTKRPSTPTEVGFGKLSRKRPLMGFVESGGGKISEKIRSTQKAADARKWERYLERTHSKAFSTAISSRPLPLLSPHGDNPILIVARANT